MIAGLHHHPVSHPPAGSMLHRALTTDELCLVLERLDADVVLRLARVSIAWRQCARHVLKHGAVLLGIAPSCAPRAMLWSAAAADEFGEHSYCNLERLQQDGDEGAALAGCIQPQVERLARRLGTFGSLSFGCCDEPFVVACHRDGLAVFQMDGRVSQVVGMPAGLVGAECRCTDSYLLVKCIARSSIPLLLSWIII